jgi:hypothetical protein
VSGQAQHGFNEGSFVEMLSVEEELTWQAEEEFIVLY